MDLKKKTKNDKNDKRYNKCFQTAFFMRSVEFSTYLFDIADCDEPVLIQEAVETVERMLPDATVPRFSKSPVLRCFFSFNPWTK